MAELKDAERFTPPTLDALTSPESLAVFARVLSRPKDHLLRIDESIESVNSTTLRRDIRFWLDLGSRIDSVPGSDGKPRGDVLILPMLAFRRDRLVNDLLVVDRDGGPLDVVNRERTMYVTSIVTRARVSNALETWSAAHGSDGRAIRDVLAELLGELPLKPAKEAQSQFAAIFTHLAGGVMTLQNRLVLQLPKANSLTEEACHVLQNNHDLGDFCRRLTTHDLMLIAHPLPASRWIRLRIVYDSAHVQRDRDGSIRGKSRRLVAHTPNAYRIHVPLALSAQSYHVRMEGPRGHYVAEQSLRVAPDARTQEDSVKGVAQGLVPLAPQPAPAVQLGRPVRPNNEAHLYVGNLDRGRIDRLYARFVFCEKPPGMLGVSCAISSFLCVILAAMLPSLSNIVERGNTSVDAAAILALAPGILAAVLLPSMSHRRVMQGPLRARAAIAFTVMSSLGAAVLLTLVQADVLADGARRPFWFLAAWALLTMANIVVFALCVRDLVRMRKHFRLACEDYRSSFSELSVDEFADAHYQYLLGR